jgi:hypothetical protein
MANTPREQEPYDTFDTDTAADEDWPESRKLSLGVRGKTTRRHLRAIDQFDKLPPNKKIKFPAGHYEVNEDGDFEWVEQTLNQAQQWWQGKLGHIYRGRRYIETRQGDGGIWIRYRVIK